MQQDTNANPPDNAGHQDDALGIIKNVRVREVWPHEAHNFTPWLAQNLGRLGQALHLDLGPSGDTEAPVGRYSLDILAQEAGSEGRKVAIENQLEWTDHTHLGQLLTYAAGHEAQIAIWIAAEFHGEHKDAIQWLNQLAGDKAEFYAVKIRAIRIDDSKPAPIFEPVVVPDGWPRQPQTVAKAPPEDRWRYREFFQQLWTEMGVSELSTVLHLGNGCFLYPNLQGNETWVNLWIGHRRAADINHIFDALKSDQEQIEVEFAGGEWAWDKRGNHPYAWIWVTRPASINDPPEKLAETRAWLAKTIIQFGESFKPRVEKILAEMESAGAGE